MAVKQYAQPMAISVLSGIRRFRRSRQMIGSLWLLIHVL